MQLIEQIVRRILHEVYIQFEYNVTYTHSFCTPFTHLSLYIQFSILQQRPLENVDPPVEVFPTRRSSFRGRGRQMSPAYTFVFHPPSVHHMPYTQPSHAIHSSGDGTMPIAKSMKSIEWTAPACHLHPQLHETSAASKQARSHISRHNIIRRSIIPTSPP